MEYDKVLDLVTKLDLELSRLQAGEDNKRFYDFLSMVGQDLVGVRYYLRKKGKGGK